MLIGMCLTGVLLGMIDRVYNGFALAPFDLAVGLSLIWPRLVIHESNWAMSFGGLPLVILFYAALRRWYLGALGDDASQIERSRGHSRKRLRVIGS